MRKRPDSRPRLAALTPDVSDPPGYGGRPSRTRIGEIGPRRADPAHVGPTERLDNADDAWTGTDSGGWVPAEMDIHSLWGGSDLPRREFADESDDDLVDESDDEDPPGVRVLRPGGHRWGRLAERWVPEPLRTSRLDPGRRGALLLTLVAAVAAVLAAIGVWRDRPEPRPVQAVALSQVTDASPRSSASNATAGRLGPPSSGPTRSRIPGVSSGESSGTVPATIVVSVTGAVRSPGLVRLVTGSRVADAIAEAGGVMTNADLTGLNLAERVSDGTSVVVAARGSGHASGGGQAANGGSSIAGGTKAVVSGVAGGERGGPLNLNTADVGALDALPGVGPVTAANIIAWRVKNGRFSSVEQLQEIPGIGPAKYANLAPLVTV